MVFGFEWWQALIIVVVGAFVVYWLLTQMSRR
jgi:cytosine/uracil/thiamine/allantoin permease